MTTERAELIERMEAEAAFHDENRFEPFAYTEQAAARLAADLRALIALASIPVQGETPDTRSQREAEQDRDINQGGRSYVLTASPSPAQWPSDEEVRTMATFLREGYGHKSQSLDFWTDDARAALLSLRPPPADQGPIEMNDAQIKHMVDRFLGWRLPDNFSPDAGIIFVPTFNTHTAHPMRHEPVGTNLFDATQATEMVRHMIKGLPVSAPPADERVKELVEALDAQAEAERLDCEHQELVDQSEAEGWDERTGGSHLTSSWKRVGLAYAHARQLRAAALASYRASDRQGGE